MPSSLGFNCPEGEGVTVLQKVGNSVPVDTASSLRRLEFLVPDVVEKEGTIGHLTERDGSLPCSQEPCGSVLSSQDPTVHSCVHRSPTVQY
jgi:hypothetical protein